MRPLMGEYHSHSGQPSPPTEPMFHLVSKIPNVVEGDRRQRVGSVPFIVVVGLERRE